MKIQRAILSVANKEGIVEFAKELEKLGIEIISTGGTATLLEQNKVRVTRVSDFTGFPEILSGRVKTLHPKIHAALLAVRENKEHMGELKKLNIPLIDMAVCNLYPFEEMIRKDKVKFKEALDNIDIGGPSMLRAAAKNYENVVAVCNPKKYGPIIRALKEQKGSIPLALRRELANEVFQHTSHYDTIISAFLQGEGFPQHINLEYEKIQDLRYGENPHQQGAFYKELELKETCIAGAKQLHGIELSYNNVLDLNDGFELVKDFEKPTVAIIKHTNPCGVASAKTIEEAFALAYAVDPMAAYGCIVAMNHPCNRATAELMKPKFIEAVIAPGYDAEALELLKTKEKLRILETGRITKDESTMDLKKVVGGLLVQTRQFPKLDLNKIQVVTKRKPTEQEMKDLLFAWKVNKHVKSNAIVFVKNQVAIGIGAGQMSRVDSSIIAARKAGEKAKGAVMSSDAFFPFRDGVDEAAKAGITAIIQPGGSIRDQEVIDAANEHTMAMVFTGVRLFKH
ncbi:bifunctional phosphoribosylaminoimidazolecarboxamide formyltransferase/IMP cyclohydrolase [Candidatus Woesearchaeota archaeon]|nr:bifunctional phosphoribosylaminoimidazolecarboxamide formyltransferase/IMP cyclohydrolase [Candidatus Woesearchaeota archaeon]